MEKASRLIDCKLVKAMGAGHPRALFAIHALLLPLVAEAMNNSKKPWNFYELSSLSLTLALHGCDRGVGRAEEEKKRTDSKTGRTSNGFLAPLNFSSQFYGYFSPFCSSSSRYDKKKVLSHLSLMNTVINLIYREGKLFIYVKW